MAAIENPAERADPDDERLLGPAGDAPAADAATALSPADAAADLGARFARTLEGLEGRSPSTNALFEVLLLEALDWGVDQHVKVKLIR